MQSADERAWRVALVAPGENGEVLHALVFEADLGVMTPPWAGRAAILAAEGLDRNSRPQQKFPALHFMPAELLESVAAGPPTVAV